MEIAAALTDDRVQKYRYQRLAEKAGGLPRVHPRVHGEISISTKAASPSFYWSGRGDLNARPPAPKLGGNPLPHLPAPKFFNDLGRLLSLSRHPSRAQHGPY